jgi:hypothetical protein
MSDGPTEEACIRELAIVLEDLFSTARKLSPTLAEIPIIGGLFITDLDFSNPLLRVCRALAARGKFHQEKPPWAPDLPLHERDIEELEHDDNSKLRLVGLFAGSLQGERWDAEHPSFSAYASGLLAYEYTPIEIRCDHELQCEFPPQPLAGLCDGHLNWRSPETLALDRKMQAMIAAHKARKALGQSPDSL